MGGGVADVSAVQEAQQHQQSIQQVAVAVVHGRQKQQAGPGAPGGQGEEAEGRLFQLAAVVQKPEEVEAQQEGGEHNGRLTHMLIPGVEEVPDRALLIISGYSVVW